MISGYRAGCAGRRRIEVAITTLLVGASVVLVACESKDAIGAGTGAMLWLETGQGVVPANAVAAEGEVGSIVSDTMSVHATDLQGKPLSGATVFWQVDFPGGGVSPLGSEAFVDSLVVTLDANGYGAVRWLLGDSAGIQQLTAELRDPRFRVTTSARVRARPGRATSIIIQPNDVALPVGDSSELTATIRDRFGNLITIPPSWSSKDSTIARVSSSGRVAARKAGTTFVVASLQSARDSVRVRVTAVAPPALGTLTVTPATLQLQGIGPTAQLSVVARNSAGAVITPSGLQWTSSNSSVVSVNATGLVTAVGAGNAEVRVQDACCTAALVPATVTVAPTSGRTVFIQEGFEDTNFIARGWFAETNLRITTAQAHSGRSALEIHFPRGARNPDHGSGTASRIQFPESQSVHLSYWVKYSSNWVGSGRPYHPHEFQFLTNKDDKWVGPSVTRLTTLVEHNYSSGGLVPSLQMQDSRNIDQSRVNVDLTRVTENRAAAGCNGNGDRYPTGCYLGGEGIYNNQKVWRTSAPVLTDAAGPLYKGDWHHVEVVFVLNSVVNGIGQADGSARYWIDGNLVLDAPGVLFRTGQHPDMAFWELLLAFHIGDGSPADQRVWIDDLVIANRR
jgi:hypothetical protein